MKLAIISTFPPRKCGIGIYTKKLADEIKNVEIVSLKEHKYTDSRVSGMIDRTLFSFLKTCEYLKKKGCTSVLIEHEYAFYNPVFFILFLLALKMRQIRVVLEMHTIVTYKDFIKKNMFRSYNSTMFLFCDAIIVHTRYAKKNLLGSGMFKKKISIVPLAIPANSQLAKKQGKRLNLLCFGFIWYDKGTDLAIKAFGNLEPVRLKIVGSINPSATEKQKRFFAKIKHMAEAYTNIEIIDRFVSEPEKMKLYQEADFIIMPYRLISQSAVLTEIWSVGKIPIVSNLAPLKEEIGNNEYGIAFESGNAQDLKKATLAIAKDSARQAKIRKNIAELCKKRSFAEIAKSIQKELE